MYRYTNIRKCVRYSDIVTTILISNKQGDEIHNIDGS